MMTWADAELAFRGRGPPPVPSRISLVFAVWLSLLLGSDTPPVSAMAPARKARRLNSCTVWLLAPHSTADTGHAPACEPTNADLSAIRQLQRQDISLLKITAAAKQFTRLISASITSASPAIRPRSMSSAEITSYMA